MTPPGICMSLCSGIYQVFSVPRGKIQNGGLFHPFKMTTQKAGHDSERDQEGWYMGIGEERERENNVIIC